MPSNTKKTSAGKRTSQTDKSPTIKCLNCGIDVRPVAGFCPSCGKSISPHEENNKQLLAIIGLLVNFFLMPGAGTIIGGNTKTGIIQLVLFLTGLIILVIGIPLLLILVGILFIIIGAILMLSIWIWALITSIIQIVNASKE